MKLDFLAIGFIAYMFFMWVPMNSMQPRTMSRTLIRERHHSLEAARKPINHWVTIISQIPKEEESKKIDLLRLLEWDAYYYAKKDLKIYSYALKDLQQKDFNFGNISPREKAMPILSPHFKVSTIENTQLRNQISSIVEKIRTAKIDNFNNRIELYTKKINEKLTDLQENPHLAPTINPLINDLIAQQLEKIKEKAYFTHDKDILNKDLAILSPYRKHIRGKNVILFEELEKMVKQTAEIGLPIIEPAPEEESSSSQSAEGLSERKTSEPELQIIPYKESLFKRLLNTIEPQKQEPTIKPVSSSFSSPSAPINTSQSSPRQRKEEITVDYPQKPEPESNPLTHEPSQARKSESSEESNKSTDQVKLAVIDTTQKQENKTEISVPAVESPISDPNTATNAIPPSNHPTETERQPSSFFWNSWSLITKNISDFLDRFFWSIYGGYR